MLQFVSAAIYISGKYVKHKPQKTDQIPFELNQFRNGNSNLHRGINEITTTNVDSLIRAMYSVQNNR